MQIVVFKLGNEHFAVEAEKVQSINDSMNVTMVPNAPKYIKGLINLRGNIKSLVDINLLLNVTSEQNENNIIILNVKDEEIGISVDEVEEVLDIEEKLIQKVEDKSSQFVKGIVNCNDKLYTIIDIDSLLD